MLVSDILHRQQHATFWLLESLPHNVKTVGLQLCCKAWLLLDVFATCLLNHSSTSKFSYPYQKWSLSRKLKALKGVLLPPACFRQV